jgi:cytochrome c-type biogenesis protein CcmH/NrfG
MGHYAESEQLRQCALEILQDVLHPDHQDVAASLASLALTYEHTGAHAKAAAALQRALQISQRRGSA